MNYCDECGGPLGVDPTAALCEGCSLTTRTDRAALLKAAQTGAQALERGIALGDLGGVYEFTLEQVGDLLAQSLRAKGIDTGSGARVEIVGKRIRFSVKPFPLGT